MAQGGNLDKEVFDIMYPDGNSNARGSQTLRETFPEDKVHETASVGWATCCPRV